MDVEGSYSKKNNTIGWGGGERERERERERGSTLKGKRERRERRNGRRQRGGMVGLEVRWSGAESDIMKGKK